MKNFFPNIPLVKYEGKDSANPMAFRYYNPEEEIAGKTMREHLKFAMSYWHTLCAEGTDMFGVSGCTIKFTFAGECGYLRVNAPIIRRHTMQLFS